MDKILPCPFCGSEARPVTTIDNEGADRTTEAIECEGCGCSTKSFPFGSKDVDPISEIIKVWNARALPNDTAFAERHAKMMKELVETKRENDQLRCVVAKSNAKCIYCALPAEDMAKCAHGFPGCGRADDLVLFGDLNTTEPNSGTKDDQDNTVFS